MAASDAQLRNEACGVLGGGGKVDEVAAWSWSRAVPATVGRQPGCNRRICKCCGHGSHLIYVEFLPVTAWVAFRPRRTAAA